MFRGKEQRKGRDTKQDGKGQWAIFYTSPQSFIITFSFSLAEQLWGLLLNFDWLFQPLIVTYRMGNFVYHKREYTKVYCYCLIFLDP